MRKSPAHPARASLFGEKLEKAMLLPHGPFVYSHGMVRPMTEGSEQENQSLKGQKGRRGNMLAPRRSASSALGRLDVVQNNASPRLLPFG